MEYDGFEPMSKEEADASIEFMGDFVKFNNKIEEFEKLTGKNAMENEEEWNKWYKENSEKLSDENE